MEMNLTGVPINAQEASSYGLVSKVGYLIFMGLFFYVLCHLSAFISKQISIDWTVVFVSDLIDKLWIIVLNPICYVKSFFFTAWFKKNAGLPKKMKLYDIQLFKYFVFWVSFWFNFGFIIEIILKRYFRWFGKTIRFGATANYKCMKKMALRLWSPILYE